MTQVEQANHARYVLAARCMTNFGLRLSVPTSAPVNATTEDLVWDRRYGLSDLDWAHTFGYHPVPLANQSASNNNSFMASLSSAQQLVLIGTAISTTGAASSTPSTTTYNQKPIPAGGCIGQATRSIAGNDEYAHSEIAAQIDVHSFQATQTDPTVVGAVLAWSSCMLKRGLTYASPLKAVADQQWSTPNVTPHELAVAEADVNCKQQTNLDAVWAAAETQFQNQQIAENLAALQAARQSRTIQMARVAAIS